MKRFLSAATLTLTLFSVSADAAQKRYEGSEAAALRCANMVAMTAVALSDTGKISEAEKDVMLGISFLILQGHVSGTWSQKKAALEVVRDRRDVGETLADFEKLAEKCLRDFPIN